MPITILADLLALIILLLITGTNMTSNLIYCVYLTIYKGNKLPPFYIGSSYTKNVIDNNYHGSVSSKKYKDIWKYELKNFPELFSTKIISYYKTRKIAIERENYFHHKLNVVKSTLYINESYANKNGYFGRSVKGKDHPCFGIPRSIESRQAMSKGRKGKPSNKDVPHSIKTKDKISKANKNRISVVDEFGKEYKVLPTDIRYISGELNKSPKKDVLIMKDKFGSAIITNSKDPRYIAGELVGYTKDMVSVKDKNNNKFFVSNKDSRFLSGELIFHTKGTVQVICPISNKIIRVSNTDPRYLSGELISAQFGRLASEKTKIKMSLAQKGIKTWGNINTFHIIRSSDADMETRNDKNQWFPWSNAHGFKDKTLRSKYPKHLFHR